MSAMHVYHSMCGHFPAARNGWVNDPQNYPQVLQRPHLSWRVLLLPLLGEKELFTKFRTNQPWDSEHNRKLIPLMPAVYRTPGSQAGEAMTNYLGVVGVNSAFPVHGTIMVQEIVDGTTNTMMLVEAPDEAAVEWTRPEDFSADRIEPLPRLVGLRQGGFLCAFADGAATFISADIDAVTLQLLLLRNDGESIDDRPWARSVHPAARTVAPPQN